MYLIFSLLGTLGMPQNGTLGKTSNRNNFELPLFYIKRTKNILPLADMTGKWLYSAFGFPPRHFAHPDWMLPLPPSQVAFPSIPVCLYRYWLQPHSPGGRNTHLWPPNMWTSLQPNQHLFARIRANHQGRHDLCWW